MRFGPPSKRNTVLNNYKKWHFLTLVGFDQEVKVVSEAPFLWAAVHWHVWSLAQGAAVILSDIPISSCMCLQCRLRSVQSDSCLADFLLCVNFAFHESSWVSKVCFPWESVQPDLDYLPIWEKQTQLEQIHFFYSAWVFVKIFLVVFPLLRLFWMILAQKCRKNPFYSLDKATTCLSF